MPTVDDLIDSLADEASDDEEAYQYLIDNTLRIITVPSAGVVLGVVHDKDTNVVSFKMSRYYKKLDLSEFLIKIYYTNADDSAGYFDVVTKTVDDNHIVFEWIVSEHASLYQGTVRFAACLYTLNGTEIEQAFNSTIGEATVLEGLNPEADMGSSTLEDLLTRVRNDAENAAETKLNSLTDGIVKDITDAATTATKNCNTATETAKSAISGCETATAAATTATEIAQSAARTLTTKSYPHKLSSGKYDNTSLMYYFDKFNDTKEYGIMIPKAGDVDCVKFGDNADLAVPTPSVEGTKGSDPYEDLDGVFWFIEANGGCEDDGQPYLTEIDGDSGFSRSHATEDTVIARNVLWYKQTESDTHILISLRSTWAPGFRPEEGAILPTGELRPYMIHAKYPLSKDANGNYRSTSGLCCAVRDISHNSLISKMATSSTGYSAKTHNDDWYVKIMFLMKYATKNTQKYYSGCSGYDKACNPSVAETGVKRIVVSNANAANFPVGTSVIFGTHTDTSTDRGASYNYDILDGATITRTAAYDDSNTALYFDKVSSTFSTNTTYRMTSFGCPSGYCDGVDGDGSKHNPTNNVDAFVIQGIELMHGFLEILGNVILKNSDGTGWHVYINPDSRNEASSVTSNYIDLGIVYSGSDAWVYPMYTTMSKGFLLPSSTFGASSSTGMCDGLYLNKDSTTGEREWLSLGYLWVGGNDGLWFVDGNVVLWNAGWHIGSRRSYIGRCGVN